MSLRLVGFCKACKNAAFGEMVQGQFLCDRCNGKAPRMQLTGNEAAVAQPSTSPTWYWSISTSANAIGNTSSFDFTVY